MRLPRSETGNFALQERLDVAIHSLAIVEVLREAHFLVARPIGKHHVAQVAHEIDRAVVFRPVLVVGLDEASAIREHVLCVLMRAEFGQQAGSR